jgi:hypothetical protein
VKWEGNWAALGASTTGAGYTGSCPCSLKLFSFQPHQNKTASLTHFWVPAHPLLTLDTCARLPCWLPHHWTLAQVTLSFLLY